MGQEILEKAGHELLHDDVDGTFTYGERSSRAGKRLLQTTTEEQNEIGVKVRKQDPNQKPSIVNGNSSVEDTSTQYMPLCSRQ